MPTYTITDPFGMMMILIQKRLKEQVSGLQQVTKDVGQLETKEKPPIMPYTALVSFANWTFSNEGHLIQMGEGDVIIKTAAPILNSIDSITPVDSLEDALKYSEFAHNVFKALHGWTIEDIAEGIQDIFGTMTRVGFTEDTRRTGLGVAVTVYRMNLEDRSAMRTTTKTAVTPNITVTFEE